MNNGVAIGGVIDVIQKVGNGIRRIVVEQIDLKGAVHVSRRILHLMLSQINYVFSLHPLPGYYNTLDLNLIRTSQRVFSQHFCLHRDQQVPEGKHLRRYLQLDLPHDRLQKWPAGGQRELY